MLRKFPCMIRETIINFISSSVPDMGTGYKRSYHNNYLGVNGCILVIPICSYIFPC